MRNLNLPTSNLTTRTSIINPTKKDVFDIVRKKWVVLTPEEEVRQSFIHYMINSLNIPLTHIGVEKSFIFENGKPQRVDIIAYDSKGIPYILIECKAPSIKINKEIFSQATRYNSYVKARYIIITNGVMHYSLSTINHIDYKFEQKMPLYL